MIRGANSSLLEKVRDLVGTGTIDQNLSSDGQILHITKTSDVQYLLSQIYPFLIEKRKEALKVLERINAKSVIVDPKSFDINSFVDYKGEVCIVPPNSFALGRTVEYFKIPRNILAIVLGKSTYARSGIILNCTPAEPGWEGNLVLEISNTTPLPCKIYSNEGIGQILFFESDEECLVSYNERSGGGKYQGQKGIVLPKV